MKQLITIVLAGFISLSAHSATIFNTPEHSLMDVQSYIDSGKWVHYPGVARLNAAQGYLFNDELEHGTALPKVANPRALLEALKRDQVVLVASLDSVAICFPIFQEIAKQNGVACDTLMRHLYTNAIDSSFFNDIEMASEKANEQVNMLIAQQVEDKLSKMQEEVTKEVIEYTKESVQQLLIDHGSNQAVVDAGIDVQEIEEQTGIILNTVEQPLEENYVEFLEATQIVKEEVQEIVEEIVEEVMVQLPSYLNQYNLGDDISSQLATAEPWVQSAAGTILALGDNIISDGSIALEITANQTLEVIEEAVNILNPDFIVDVWTRPDGSQYVEIGEG